MDDIYKAIVVVVGLLVTVVGFALGITRNQSAKFKEVYGRMDRIKDDYVRRDDLAKELKYIKDGQDDMNKKIDRLIDRK